MSDHRDRDELDEAFARKERDIAELRVRLASTAGELRGRAIATIDALRSDPELLEALRCLAWIRTPRSRGEPKRPVEIDPATGRPTTKIEGWPKGVDADTFTKEYLVRWRDNYLTAFDAHALGDPPEPEETPSVKRLRDALGAGGDR